MVSDKLRPHDPHSNSSCGVTGSNNLSWVEATANIQIVPQSQPCQVSLDGLLSNAGFESPPLCQGIRDCSVAYLNPDGSTPCVGVSSSPPANVSSWSMSPWAGISFDGWDGDFSSPERLQHLYLLPGRPLDAVVDQTVGGMTLGGSFQLLMYVGASANEEQGMSFEAFFNLSLLNSWEIQPPSVNISLLQYNPAKPFNLVGTSSFTSYRNSYRLVLRAPSKTAGNTQGQMVFVDDVHIKFLAFNMLEGGSLRFPQLQVIDPDYSSTTAQLLKKNGLEFIVSVQLSVQHGVLSLVLGHCDVMPPSSKISAQQLSEWGAQCAAHLNDSQISVWANQSVNETVYRPTCPVGWYGSDTETAPCINIPVTSISVLWKAPYTKSLFPAGQQLIPTRTISLTANITNLRKVINERLVYQPDRFFNTNNLGKEFLHVFCNDHGNFGSRVSNPINQSFPINIININNQPNITFQSSTETSLENQTVRLSGFVLSDPDIDEIPCKQEPCKKGQGNLVLKIDGLNGTLNASSNDIVDVRTLLARHYGFVTKDSYLQLCIMKISCNPYNNFLSLNGTLLVQICNQTSLECDRVKAYCAIANMGLGGLSETQCVQSFVGASLYQQLSSSALQQAEVALQTTMLGLMSGKYVLSLANSSSLLLLGALKNVQSIIDSRAIYYHPPQYYNGLKLISLQLNDLGNVGIGYPCYAPADVPEELMFAHCSRELPFMQQTITRDMKLQIRAVNNAPVLYTFDALGTLRYSTPFPTMQAEQNITTALNKMEVEDVDIAQTPGCMMNVSIQTGSGGTLFLNASLTSAVNFVTSTAGSLVSFYGFVQDINFLLAHVQYRSDPQFTGMEAIRFKLDDNGCTGITLNARNDTAVTYTINVVVSRPQTCIASSCSACIRQRIQKCGWCPSACGGSGRCMEAVSVGGPPKYGTCSAYCDASGCYSWNTCVPRQVNTWGKTSTGVPILFVLLVFLYMFFMWARRNHGTFPIYLVKLSGKILRSTQHYSVTPQENAHTGKIFYLITVVFLAGLIPGLIASMNKSHQVVQSLERAMSINLQTDSCNVNFVTNPSIGLYDPTYLSFDVSPSGGASGISVSTDFCSEDQYVKIENTNPVLNRYRGYTCEIQVQISSDPNHIIPTTSISNVGTNPTVVAMQNPNDVINFGPNSLSLEGTNMQVELLNVRARILLIPGLHDGFVNFQNFTFQSITAMTTNADLQISVSDDSSMLLPYNLQYEQGNNEVCFLSKDDPGFQLNNFCRESVHNVSTTANVSRIVNGQLVTTVVTSTQIVREWSCTQSSSATLLPYQLQNNLGTARIQVNLISSAGQIYFSSIPLSRLPPSSGSQALDSLYLYDGIASSRSLALQNTSAAYLKQDFHPGESSRPQADWYEIKLNGPGAPPGSFLWVSSHRYLVVPRFLLYLISFGLLVPKSQSITLNLKPSPCPSVDLGSTAAQQFTRPNQTIEFPGGRRSSVGNVEYLIQYYQLIFATVDGSNMAANSILVYRQDVNTYISFERDRFTGQMTAASIQRSNNSFVIIILALGLGLPFVFALGLSVYVGLKIRVAVDELRERAIEDEMSLRTLFEGSKLQPNSEQYQKIVDSLFDQFYAKTNLFYIIDTLITEADHAQSIYEQIPIFVTHILIIAISSVPSLLFALNLSAATHRYVCPTQMDKSSCEASFPDISWAIVGICIFYFVLSFMELYAFYANLAWSNARKFLRRAWYSALTLIFTASAYYFFIVMTWIVFGLFFQAAFFLPYVVAVLGVIFVIGRYSWMRKQLYQRIKFAVGEQSSMLLKKKVTQIPKESLETLIKKNVNKMLMRKRVSLGSHINSIWLMLLCMIMLDVFLLVSFATFTDTTSIGSGVLNSVIVAVVAFAIDYVAQRRQKQQSTNEDIREMVSEIVLDTRMAIQFIAKQVDMGAELLRKARKMELERETQTNKDLMQYEDHLDERFQDLVAGHYQLQKIQKSLARKGMKYDKVEKHARIPVVVEDEKLVPLHTVMGEMESLDDEDWPDTSTVILVLQGYTAWSDLEELREALAGTLDVSVDRIQMSDDVL